MATAINPTATATQTGPAQPTTGVPAITAPTPTTAPGRLPEAPRSGLISSPVALQPRPIPPPPVGPRIGDIQGRIFDPLCSGCHTGSSAPSGLRLGPNLDPAELRRRLVTPFSDGQRYIEPDNPSRSIVWKRVTSNDDNYRMPYYGTPLAPELIKLLEQWIKNGAPQ